MKKPAKINTYVALVANNGQTEVVTVEATNLNVARNKAEVKGCVVCLALDKPGHKINF